MRATSIKISEDQIKRMETHVRACLPREACGVLAGEQGNVHWVEPIANVENSNSRFRMDPQAQLEVILRIEEQGLSLLGIYHSHPQGPDRPSETDFQEAAYPQAAHLIWSPLDEGWICKAYVLENDTAQEIPIHVHEEGTRIK